MDINDPTDLGDVFAYLDDLRESGKTNMLGAGEYLCIFMGLNTRTARQALTAWMDSFSMDDPHDRAKAHLEGPKP